MPKVASGQPTRSAERLLKVLKVFASDKAEWTATEIGRHLGLATSTVRRLLLILQQEGFVRRDLATSRFRIHHEVIGLAAAALRGNSLIRAAAPLLDELSATLDEAVQLTLRDGADLIVVESRQSRHLVKTFHHIGHRYPAYKGSAAGKVHLAWMPEAELAALLPSGGRWPAATPRGIATIAAFKRALAETRKQGYGLNEAETEPEVWSVAAPVRDRSGRTVAAIHVPCHVGRLTPVRQRRIIAAVVKAAEHLSAILPFAP